MAAEAELSVDPADLESEPVLLQANPDAVRPVAIEARQRHPPPELLRLAVQRGGTMIVALLARCPGLLPQPAKSPEVNRLGVGGQRVCPRVARHPVAVLAAGEPKRSAYPRHVDIQLLA